MGSQRFVYADYLATTPVDKRVLTEMLPYFSENKCILQYDKQYAKDNSGNTHKYLNDLFAVYVIPKSENCSMQSQAALSTLLNTFDFYPVAVDLTSCNILPPKS